MADLSRRSFFKSLASVGAGAAVGLPLLRAFGGAPSTQTEFFVFIFAAGGWDVTLWSDPRNQRIGLIEPTTTAHIDTTGLKRWQGIPLDSERETFALVQPPGSNLTFGPAIGDLADWYDRLCVVNGISMKTVSHTDGTAYMATGRHLAGGHIVASSVDAVVTSELGVSQLCPLVSIQFPSAVVGRALDPRAAPLRVREVGAIYRSLSRSEAYDTAADRDAVTALLTEEASDLATRSYEPGPYEAMAHQFEALRAMLGSDVAAVFHEEALRASYPRFDYASPFQGPGAVNAAFAVEAMRRNVIRCASFTLGDLDDHNWNYRDHAKNLQAIFDLIAALLSALEATPHPTLPGEALLAHTHLLVLSEFCRTPGFNLGGGRDHWPNNSALIVSPRFRRNFVIGRSDPEQLLPMESELFSSGPRAIEPPDLLATFLGAFGIDPAKYLRDGEIIEELLAP